MESNRIIKVVIIGPESTGKSTLSEQLADHFHTSWCPEYAREYLLKHGTGYTYDDLLTIAKGQIELEERTGSQPVRPAGGLPAPVTITIGTRLLFIDTDMYVMKVWCDFVFGKCHQYILDEIKKRKYDLYLLCNVDLPWVKDELGEYPDLETREKLYGIYKDLMMHQPVPWVDISGNYEERLRKAIYAVNNLIKKTS